VANVRSSMRACAGSPVTITVSLSGIAPFTVRWSDGLVQSNITTNTLTRTVTVSRDGTLTIVSVADATCAINDTPQNVRIVTDPKAAILEQPHEVRIPGGRTATLTVDVTAGASVAWFEGLPGDASRPVGTNDRSFITPTLTRTTRYWVRVSNRCGSVDSAPIVVIVTGKSRAVRR
jgi:hypothetical protein